MGLGFSIDPKKFADAAGDKAQLEILAASLPRSCVVVQGWVIGLEIISQYALNKQSEWNRAGPGEQPPSRFQNPPARCTSGWATCFKAGW